MLEHVRERNVRFNVVFNLLLRSATSFLNWIITAILISAKNDLDINPFSLPPAPFSVSIIVSRLLLLHSRCKGAVVFLKLITIQMKVAVYSTCQQLCCSKRHWP